MNLHKLQKITQRSKKRVGRGHGSGRVKTAGRGEKGQKKRSRVRPDFEGGQLRLVERLPFARGRGFKPQSPQSLAVGLGELNQLKDGVRVNRKKLIEMGLVPDKVGQPIKILKKGRLERKLILENLLVSKSARKEIEKLGGRVII